MLSCILDMGYGIHGLTPPKIKKGNGNGSVPVKYKNEETGERGPGEGIARIESTT